MPRADDIVFRMGADTSRFTRQMGFAGTALKGFIAGAVASFSTSALKEVISDVSEIGKKADRVGLTTDALQELRFAGELTGVATNALDIGMQRFARRIAEVANGAENDLGKVLKANNITLREGDGRLRSQSDILGDYAELIKNVGSEQDRTRLAFLAFDSEGVAMVNTLKNGRDGLEEMREEARKLGIVISEDMVRAAEELDDKFTRITARMAGVWKKFVVGVATGIDGIVRDIGEFNTAVNNLTDPGLVRRLELLQIGLENARRYGDDKDIANAERELVVLKELISQRQKADEKRFGSGSFAKPTIVPAKETAEQRKLRSEAEKAAKDAARANAAEARAIEQVIAALQLEYDNLSRTQVQQRIYNELKRAGIDANSDAGKSIADMVTMIDAENAALERAEDQMELLARSREDNLEIAGALFDEGIRIGEAFEQGADKGRKALQELGREILITLARAAILGQNPVNAFFGTGPRLQTFALGGISNKPAIFGDGPTAEAAVPLPDGRSIPVKWVDPGPVQMNGQSQNMHITLGISSDANGNLLPFVEKISQRNAATAMRNASPAIINQSVAATQRSFSTQPGRFRQ